MIGAVVGASTPPAVSIVTATTSPTPTVPSRRSISEPTRPEKSPARFADVMSPPGTIHIS